MAWASAILSTTHGGIKNFDPCAQAQALLAKMVVRGLLPRPEPWKYLIQHKIKSLQLSLGGAWRKDDSWLFSAKKVINQGSPLWQGICWLQVCLGIEKV